MIKIWLSIIGLFLSTALSIYYIVKVFQQKSTNKRYEAWFEHHNQERKSFILLIGDKFDDSELAEELSKKLIRANITLKPSEYIGLSSLVFFVLWFVNSRFLALFFPLDIILAYFLVWLGSRLFLQSRQDRLSEEMNKQLPEICRMIANAVKAGLTIPQSIEMVSQEMKAPAKPEFQRMHQQLQLGDDLEEVMSRFRNRIASDELDIFISTILIQQRVGGNLSEVLALMANTIEERMRIHKEVQTVTAEAKFVSTILPLLPIFMAMMMNMFIPGFLNPLFTPIGFILLGIFAGFQFLAFIIIKRLSTIKV